MESFEGIYHLLLLCTSTEVGGEHRIGEVDVDLLKGLEAGARRHLEINIEDPSSATEALGLLGHR